MSSLSRPGGRLLRSSLFLCALCAAPAGAPPLAAAPAGVGRPYQRLIEDVAARHRLDPKLFGALVDEESARRSGAISHKGAQGLAQLMPATARRFGVTDPHNPEDNLHGAARYLRWLLERYDDRVDLALAAYNAGEGNVDRFGDVPPFPETMTFVQRVMRRAGLEPPTSGAGVRPSPKPVRLVKRADGTLLLTNSGPRSALPQTD